VFSEEFDRTIAAFSPDRRRGGKSLGLL
jgi:hypothetical protein